MFESRGQIGPMSQKAKRHLVDRSAALECHLLEQFLVGTIRCTKRGEARRTAYCPESLNFIFPP